MKLFTEPTVILWLCVAVALTMAELVKLNTVDSLIVPCHQSVTLQCSISTSQDGLSVTHMAWVRQDGKCLCDVNETGVTGTHPGNTPSVMECSYTPQTQLTLTLLQVQPLEQGEYLCKLRSNKGVKTSTTTVKLQECYREAQPSSLVVPEHGEGRVKVLNASGAGAIGPVWKPWVFLLPLSTLFKFTPSASFTTRGAPVFRVKHLWQHVHGVGPYYSVRS